MKRILATMLILGLSATVLGACTYQEDSSNSVQSKQLEENQEKLIQAIPVPQVEQSSDRKAIAARAETFADENKVSYVYLISYGKVMSFHTIKGKVVSIRSYMTPQEQIVSSRGVPCYKNGVSDPDKDNGYCSSGYVVQAPDIDGTYGDNADAVFFFTTEGAYVEWAGEYMVSDQPLKLTTQPELVRQIN